MSKTNNLLNDIADGLETIKQRLVKAESRLSRLENLVSRCHSANIVLETKQESLERQLSKLNHPSSCADTSASDGEQVAETSDFFDEFISAVNDEIAKTSDASSFSDVVKALQKVLDEHGYYLRSTLDKGNTAVPFDYDGQYQIGFSKKG